MRYAIIELASALVTNVVEIDAGDGSVISGDQITVASDAADIGDAWDGAQIIRKPEPQGAPI